MKLSDTFFDSLKITWKNKPMWKFNFYIFLPILLISMFLYIAPFILLMLNEYDINALSLGENGDIILTIVMLITTILYLVVYFGGLIALQLGSNIQCWQECNGEKISNKKELFKAILRKILPSIPFYLAFIILPYILMFGLIFGFIYLIGESGEPAFIILLILLLFAMLFLFYLGLYLTFIFLPVTLHEHISFKKRVKLLWLYLRNHFWDVFVYALIVGVFDIVANTIIYIPYMAIYMIMYIPSIMLMVQGDEDNFFIVFAVFMLIMLVVAVIVMAFKNLITTAKQTAFTRFYYQKYSVSEEMQKMVSLSPPVQLEE